MLNMRIMICLASLLLASIHASELALGHPDWYPSPEQPLGWRGDGTGSWPGAKVVTQWDAAKGTGVAWSVDTPGVGLCQPIVAGEKVFITADPNLLCCYSVHDGTLLWQTAIDHTVSMSAAEGKAARAEQAFWDAQWLAYSRWRCAVEALGRKGTLKTIGTGFQRQGQRLPFADEAEHQENMRTFKGDAGEEYKRLQEEGSKRGWCKQMGNNGPMLLYRSKKWPLQERYFAAQKKWGVWYSAYNNWLGYTTYSFATPVTDGTFIYVTTANNAVAALDYHGKIQWQIWDQLPDQQGLLHTRYVASPALFRGVLLVKHSGHLRAYEAKSGKKLWEIRGPGAVVAGKKVKSNYVRCDPEGAGPLPMWLGDEKNGFGVVYDGGGRLWSLLDGKLVHKGMEASAYNNGIVVQQADGSALVATKSQVYQIRGSSGKVEVKSLWKSSEASLLKFNGATLFDGKIVGQPSGGKKDKSKRGYHPAYDLLTGQVSWPFSGQFRASTYITPIAVGTTMYAFTALKRNGHDLGQKLGHGIAGVQSCVVAPVGKKPHRVEKAVIDERFAGDDDFAVTNKTHGWGYQQSSSPSAQANRLFYRTRGTLWCIGDSKQRFPVPKQCPKHARIP